MLSGLETRGYGTSTTPKSQFAGKILSHSLHSLTYKAPMSVLTAVACRLAVRTAAIPTDDGSFKPSPAHQSSPPSPPLTRVILPKKKPLKWSTGTAPGEYGGPPTTNKLRKYWGGGDVDPITATDDFIWNKDFVGHMKRHLSDQPDAPSPFLPQVDQSSGFLSLNRAMNLDNVGIDLSKELHSPPNPVLEQQVEAARNGRSFAESRTDVASPRWRLAPTRRELAKWDRANKAATGGSDVIIRESSRARGDPRVLAAQYAAEYHKLKKQLQVLTLVIGGVGTISAYVSYSPEIAASFGAGFLGSLIYVRMLGNSVDSMAAGAKGFLKAAIGQPRLLVPVAIVMIYIKWNQILVPEHGFIHLELIPMLVGFFTYKVATFIQAIQGYVTVVDDRRS